MIAGHFGFAALTKARERQVPLWTLMLATVWLDIVFVPLFLAGLESIEAVPGTSGGYGAGIIHADYTHSLLGALVLAGIFGFVGSIPFGRRCGVVLGAVVFSHWLLDLIVHRGDMPFLPGNAGNLPKLGFGLWRWPRRSDHIGTDARTRWSFFLLAGGVCVCHGRWSWRRWQDQGPRDDSAHPHCRLCDPIPRRNWVIRLHRA
jgi:hypothetical protein